MNENTNMNNAAPAQGEKKTNFFGELFDWMSSIFSAVLCFIVIFTLFARIITVDGTSMVPTLLNQQRLIVSDFMYTPQYGDIVILYADKLYNEQTSSYGKTIVKRIIGLTGDKIKIDFTNGIVYRNGEALSEPYTNTPTNLPENFPNNTEVTVGEGKVFVLGDNRNGSKDSRSNDVGQIDMRYIMGKAYLRIWPISELGNIYD